MEKKMQREMEIASHVGVISREGGGIIVIGPCPESLVSA